MIKAGYIQRSGYPAFDYEGNRHQILEICISKNTYAVLVRDLRRILYTGDAGFVWRIKQNWGRHLTVKTGEM